MAHATPAVLGLFPGRRLNLWSGPWSQTTCVDDWNRDNFDHTGLGFVGGGLLTAGHEVKPIGLAAGPVPRGVPRFGPAWKAWLHASARSIGTAGAQLESLPYEHNLLDLDPAVTDPCGVPVVRVTYRVGDSDRRGYRFLRGKLDSWLREAGASETWWSEGVQLDPRHAVRRNPHGRRFPHVRRRPLRLLPRVPEPRTAERLVAAWSSAPRRP